MPALQKDVSAVARCREEVWEKGTDQVPISWCMAQDTGCHSAAASFWAAQFPPCMAILESCSKAAGLISASVHSGQGKKSPVVKISQPCFPVKLSLITTALSFLPALVSQIVPAWLFPASAQCCQLVSAQPGKPSSNCLASK